MKKIKLLTLAAAFLLTAGVVTSCGGGDEPNPDDPPIDNPNNPDDPNKPDDGGEIPEPEPIPVQDVSGSITVWAPQEHQELYKKFIKDFLASDEEYSDCTINLGVCSEADAYTNVSKAPEDAADVYTFANDQLFNLINVGGLSEVGGLFKQNIESQNSEGIVNAAKQGDKLYAWPISSDNGYFLYYDASVVSGYNESTSFQDLLDQCKAANKKLGVNVGDSWYGYGIFSGFGAKYEVTYDKTGKETAITCDYDGAKGMKAAKFVDSLARQKPTFQYIDGGASGDASFVLNTYIGNLDTCKTLGAFVGGTWLYADVAEAWGEENVRCSYLPLLDGDDSTSRMRSFIGGKMIGVNSFSKNRTLAYYFADYISSYECQMQRFETLGMGPSNLHALEEEDVKANKALSGLAEQVGMAGDAQINVPSTFWSAVQNFGVAVGYQNKTGMTDAQLQAELDKLVEDITTLSSGN